MQDREPTYPGRVTLTPVYGLANTYDMERADRPLQEGTPLNKASLLKDATAALYGKTNAAVPDDILSLLSKSTLAQIKEKYTKTTIGTLAVGKTITLNISGKAKEFIVVHQGKPSSLYDDSCGGTWLLMKDIYENRVWQSGNINKYESSDINTYLNSTFLNLFDSNIKDAIKQVKIPYRKNGGSGGTDQSGANGLPAKIFLLSSYEVGWTTSNSSQFPVDGAKLDYFVASSGGNSKRIANFNGAAARWWLRSPNAAYTSNVWIVDIDGVHYNYYASSSYGIRPALILPSTFAIYTDSSGNIYTEQEYETTITDVLGNLIAIPAGQIKDGVKLATGSYTGTGTYGESHPNSLTFDFEPKLVIVYQQNLYDADKITTQSYWGIFTQFTILRSASSSNRFGASCVAPLAWGNTLTWWTRSNDSDAADYQGNVLNNVYQYIAIG